MSPRNEARTARVLVCLTAGAAIAALWQASWFQALLLTVTTTAAERWAHHARRVAARPTHRRTA